jgi:hypothetical protein
MDIDNLNCGKLACETLRSSQAFGFNPSGQEREHEKTLAASDPFERGFSLSPEWKLAEHDFFTENADPRVKAKPLADSHETHFGAACSSGVPGHSLSWREFILYLLLYSIMARGMAQGHAKREG